MSEEFNLRSKDYWKHLGLRLFLGRISAVAAFIFILLMNLEKKVTNKLKNRTKQWK